MKQQEAIVKMAVSQLGVEEPKGEDKYIEYYNQLTGSKFSNTVNWCAIFVTWCARHVGVSTDVILNFASCTAGRMWFRSKGVWHAPKGYTPKPGDIVMFDWDLSGNCDHVGIVESVSKTTLTTIEGNTKGGYQVEGVRRKQYSLDSKYIAGYANPKYIESSGAQQSELPVEKPDDKKEDESAMAQEWTDLKGTGDQPDTWAKEATDYCKAKGLFQGDGAGNYGWKLPISREEVAQVLYRWSKMAQA